MEPVTLRFVVGQNGQGGDAAVHIPWVGATPETLTIGRCLRITWRRIPLSARHTIARHWGRRWGAPHITVVPAGASVEVAQTWDNGCSVEFCGPVLARLPAHLAGAVIAHELAHCWQRATGLWSRELAEDQAHAIASAWGFPIPEASDHLHCLLLAARLGA